MSVRALVLCGGSPAGTADKDFEKKIALDQQGPKENVHIKVTNVTGLILRDLQPLCRDLLDIATYVYVADSSISRGGPTDIFGSAWSRQIRLRIPVRDLAKWSDPKIRESLEGALSYLTGDSFTFEFVSHQGDIGQQYLEFQDYNPYPGADCLSLFSGGADSLAGVIDLVKKGRKPLLISHRSAPILDTRQKNLRNALCREIPEWSIPAY